ncbi:ABC transporter ATP-binding protein [Salinisphaera orenii]|uniref:ABC transporter ATP-binding protein n=1 Tax=Salinisphaera orenii YIM 95161 TaxID=1051139 RepID=A0A423PMR8_9GAMM|nr:ABC transporter ATP-binding protein [Salinisphaera halophila]ROO26890.1 ABC transporter ATP-binding protein [Salinisphaera halophila YIM 95161]
MLSVHDFHAGYPSVPVVSGAELRVERGEIVSLFGHNGAGKSTLMKGVFGVLGDCRGEVRFNDTAVAGASTRSLMRRGMVLVPQERGVFPSLTVAENLRMGFWASGESARAEYDRRLARTLGYLPILDERKDDRAGELSGGQQQMVSIGRALLAGPKLLLLDEPSTGLAPNLVDDIMALVTRLREEEGLSVLLVEQNVGQALAVSDRVYLMKGGRIIHEATPDQLTSSRSLWDLF